MSRLLSPIVVGIVSISAVLIFLTMRVSGWAVYTGFMVAPLSMPLEDLARGLMYATAHFLCFAIVPVLGASALGLYFWERLSPEDKG